MALTLAEAAELSNDVLLQGVIETIIKESPMLGLVPFDLDVVGNAVSYNRETTAPAAGTHAVGGTWQESAPEVTQVSAALKIYGGDADVDQYLATTRSNVNDLQGEVIEQKAKALAHLVEEGFIYHSEAADSTQFDGLHRFMEEGPATQTIAMGSSSTPGALELVTLAAMIDAVKPGKPDFLLTTRAVRRGISSYARALTSPVTYEPNEFGQRVMFFDGIPLLTSDFMLDTETITNGGAEVTASTGGSGSSIFAVKVGDGHLKGISNGGIQVEPVGALETKDARRWRVKWYMALMLGGTLSVARLAGIASGSAVTEAG